jgi:putative SOS response-associated peptidase YedK
MDAAPSLRDIHPRMPIAVAPELFAAWLDPDQRDAGPLLARIRGGAPASYRVHPVSPRVNATRFDDPACIAPVPEPPRQQSLL